MGRNKKKLAVAVLIGAVGAAAWWGIGRRRARTNLLLVTIDTLRADHVGAYGDAQAVTPSLDGLAARGVRFEHAQSPVPLTGPSHATILTGLYPPVHGVRDNVVFTLDPRHLTLATLLKAQGYRTAAFVGAYPVAAAFGFRQGFDAFSENFKESESSGGAQRSDVADDALGRWPGRRLALLRLAALLRSPRALRPRAVPTMPRGSVLRRRGRLADAQLGRVFEWSRPPRETRWWPSSPTTRAGEHGEVTHAVLVYEATLRVPFLVAGPGIARGVAVPGRVSTLDVAPTLLGLLGVDPPPKMKGRDLGPGLRGQPLAAGALYAESLFGRLNCRWSSLRAWTDGDWKLVDGSRAELFDLAGDPGGTRDRSGDEAPRVQRMRAALRAAVLTMTPSGDRAHTATITPEQEAPSRASATSAARAEAETRPAWPARPIRATGIEIYERLQIAAHAPNVPVERVWAAAAAIAQEDPGNPFAFTTAATLAYRAGRLADAAGAFRRALELDPERPAVRQNYGKLLRDMDRLEESEKELRLALGQTDAQDAGRGRARRRRWCGSARPPRPTSS